MRNIACLCLVLAAAVGAAWGQQEWLFTPMKGSATPEFQAKDQEVRCLIFGTNIVKTSPSEDGGEDVRIWRREGKATGLDACELKAAPYAEIKDSDNNAFYGISAVYFFIDTGTSAGSRTLMVYKTGIGDLVTRVDYFANSAEPRIEAARYLYYDALSNKKGTGCKDAAKFKRSGGSVGWVQGKKMDLDDQTIANVGALRCTYLE
jgi:hypothetical protein